MKQDKPKEKSWRRIVASLFRIGRSRARYLIWLLLSSGWFLNAGCGVFWIGTQSKGTSSPPSTEVEYDGNYNGVLNVKAFGDAPGAGGGTPTTRQVSFTWLAFTGATVSTAYKLLRIAKGENFVTSATGACTAGTTTTCQICSPTGIGVHTCTDTNVAASPQQYDYGVVDASLNYTPVAVTVAIPPDNMILVQRDAANYEMCQLLGKTSDPRNKMRCPYTGLGAIPYNTNPGGTALNLTTGYYDFGYNLFVDRWEAACNWTNAANGGACNTLMDHTTAGNCFGVGAPNNATGAAGNVYYDTTNARCYYNPAGVAWVIGASATPAQLAAMYTIHPASNGGYKPPLTELTASQVWTTCQAISDPDYGAKRVMRHREFIAASAWPTLTDEPGALTPVQLAALEAGSGHGAGVYSCNSDAGAGICPSAFTASECGGGLGSSTRVFVIGSAASSLCVSRFGAQDLVGGVSEWLSDNITCSNVTHTCTGITSIQDTGNTDMNGFNFDGIQGPGSNTGGQAAAAWTSFWNFEVGIAGGTSVGQGFGAGYFSAPLGLPLFGTDSGNGLLISSMTNIFHGDYFRLSSDNGTANRSLYVGGHAWDASIGGRWHSQWWGANTISGLAYGFRCAVPAD
jgi:hypothetical protein